MTREMLESCEGEAALEHGNLNRAPFLQPQRQATVLLSRAASMSKYGNLYEQRPRSWHRTGVCVLPDSPSASLESSREAVLGPGSQEIL